MLTGSSSPVLLVLRTTVLYRVHCLDICYGTVGFVSTLFCVQLGLSVVGSHVLFASILGSLIMLLQSSSRKIWRRMDHFGNWTWDAFWRSTTRSERYTSFQVSSLTNSQNSAAQQVIINGHAASTPPHLPLLGLVFLWFANIVFNVVIFIYTFKRTFALRRKSDHKTLLHNIMLTDGSSPKWTVMCCRD